MSDFVSKDTGALWQQALPVCLDMIGAAWESPASQVQGDSEGDS